MTDNAIEIQGIEKQLGKFRLGPWSLNIPRGAIYGFIGPNGAGKTTTFDLLMGMGQADAGVIRILGRDPAREEVDIKQRIAYVSPDLNYQAWSTVGRAINFVRGFYPDWDQRRCERLQADFGVPSEAEVTKLSFGARIKLALVMALSRDAELLLLDEPTVGLDAIARRRLFTELLAFMQREERTVLISSHQLVDLERFADHIAIIDRGRLLTAGRVDQLLERFTRVQVQLRGSFPMDMQGTRVLEQDTKAAVLLLDLDGGGRESLRNSGLEVAAETRLTLEDLFLALVAPAQTTAK